MTDELVSILRGLRSRLEDLYQARLCQMVLFGSQARGDGEPGSDVDVLVVLTGDVDAVQEIHRTSDIITDLSLRHNVLISCVFIDKASFDLRNGPLLRNVRREGIAV